MCNPNWYAIMQNINLPEVRSTVSAFNNMTDTVGRGVAPYLGGVLADIVGLKQALLLVSLFWLFCAILWVPLIIKVPEDEKTVRKILSERKKKLEQEG